MSRQVVDHSNEQSYQLITQVVEPWLRCNDPMLADMFQFHLYYSILINYQNTVDPCRRSLQLWEMIAFSVVVQSLISWTRHLC